MTTSKADKHYGEIAEHIQKLELSYDEIFELLASIEYNAKNLCRKVTDEEHEESYDPAGDNVRAIRDDIIP